MQRHATGEREQETEGARDLVTCNVRWSESHGLSARDAAPLAHTILLARTLVRVEDDDEVEEEEEEEEEEAEAEAEGVGEGDRTRR